MVIEGVKFQLPSQGKDGSRAQVKQAVKCEKQNTSSFLGTGDVIFRMLSATSNRTTTSPTPFKVLKEGEFVGSQN